MSTLRVPPDSCDFSNGDLGYLQHDRVTAEKARVSILRIAQRFTDHKWLQETIDRGDEVHPSYAARMISECCPRPVDRAWHRFSCMDTKYREWGQPFYRDNPQSADCQTALA